MSVALTDSINKNYQGSQSNNGNTKETNSTLLPNHKSEFDTDNESQYNNQQTHQEVSQISVSSLSRSQRELESSFHDNPDFYQIVKLTQSNDFNAIRDILSKKKNIEITEIIDSKGFSVLHKTVLNQNLQLLKLFFEYAENLEDTKHKNKDDVNEQLKIWINYKNSDGYTALHFSSFKGNTDIIEYLLEKGSDMNAQNNIGLNVMHLAGQGDQPKSLALFHQKGMKFLTFDNKKTTPLHWASYLNSENAVNYLISKKWNAPLNMQDNDGLTPLHLAVISGNSRIVKKLLIKGADKQIVDQTGNTPINLAKDNEFYNIVDMLTEKNSLARTCNIKPGFRPQSKSLQQVAIFIGLYLLGTLIFIVFQFPIYDISIIIIYTIVCIFNLLLFSITWLRNPGKIVSKNQTTQDLLNLMKISDPSNICPECYVIKPQRSRHCEICKMCVSHYDHHCPWINNCVGVKNHKFFLMYIITMWLNLFLCIFFTMLELFFNNYKNLNNSYFQWFNNQSDGSAETIFLIQIIVCGLNSAMCITFFLPLSILVYVQLNNFLMNKTTFERFSAKQSKLTESSILDDSLTESLLAKKEKEREEQQKLLQNQNANQQEKNIKNCVMMCCKNQMETDEYDDNQDNFEYHAINSQQHSMETKETRDSIFYNDKDEEK